VLLGDAEGPARLAVALLEKAPEGISAHFAGPPPAQ